MVDGSLFDWFNWLINWLNDWLIDWLFNWLVDRVLVGIFWGILEEDGYWIQWEFWSVSIFYSQFRWSLLPPGSSHLISFYHMCLWGQGDHRGEGFEGCWSSLPLSQNQGDDQHGYYPIWNQNRPRLLCSWHHNWNPRFWRYGGSRFLYSSFILIWSDLWFKLE